MSVLAVLKIIGIVLLVVIGVILALVLLVLFAPIRFRVEGAHEDQWEADARVSFLGFVVRFSVSYHEESLRYALRIFGVKLFSSEEKKLSGNKKGHSSEVRADALKDKEVPSENQANAAGLDVTAAGNAQDVILTTAQAETSQKVIKPKKAKKPKKEKKRQRKDAKGQDKPSGVKEMTKKVISVLQIEEMKGALARIKKELTYILAHFRPKQAVGEISFGLGSPDLTGELLGIISWMPFVYGKRFHLYPDFMTDDPYVSGYIKLRGHFRLIIMLIAGLRILFDRNIKALIRQVKA